jgi:hypothetical protein
MLRINQKFITNRLTVRQKVRLVQIRDRVRFRLKRLLHPSIAKETVCEDISPLFVLGSNRSGASLCTLMLSQHPDLEGIFGSDDIEHRVGESGHASNSVEANHIWSILNNPDHDLTLGENVLWGLPDFVSKLYIPSVGKTERAQLIHELRAVRKTDFIPLIDNNLNIFRIPLIKSLFPNAKFVLITRDYQSYIDSCSDKWSRDREVGIFASDSFIDSPHIGLHWFMINSIALYDLKKHAPDDYFLIKLEDLHGGKDNRAQIINNVFQFAGLESVELEDNVFRESLAHVLSTGDQVIDRINSLVGELIDYENALSHPSSDETTT